MREITELVPTAFLVVANTDLLKEVKPDTVAAGFREFAMWCHEANAKWWQDPETGQPIERNYCQLVGLMHSEVSEALEADRKNKADDKLTWRSGLEVELADMIIRVGDFAGGTKREVLFGNCVQALCEFHEDIDADLDTDNVAEKLTAIHYELSMAYMHFANGDLDKGVIYVARASFKAIVVGRQQGLSIFSALKEKMEYNAKRVDHTHEHRRTKEGKKY
jgi:hypothetical protein